MIEKNFIPGGLKSLVRQMAPHEQQLWTSDLAPEGARESEPAHDIRDAVPT